MCVCGFLMQTMFGGSGHILVNHPPPRAHAGLDNGGFLRRPSPPDSRGSFRYEATEGLQFPGSGRSHCLPGSILDTRDRRSIHMWTPQPLQRLRHFQSLERRQRGSIGLEFEFWDFLPGSEPITTFFCSLLSGLV